MPDVRFTTRAFHGIRRRVRLRVRRLRHRAVTFGDGCDVRPPFRLTVRRDGSAVFGMQCVLDHEMVLEVSGRLTVGARTVFGHHCTIAVEDSVTIGEDCLVAELVSIRDHDHAIADPEVPVREQGRVTSPVVIGRNVWLGSKATVLRGVTIGDGAVIGAGAVVTKDIPAGAVAVGVPARVVRRRSEPRDG